VLVVAIESVEVTDLFSSPRLRLCTLTAHDAQTWLDGPDPGGLLFTEDYPSTFATELLRLVALYPVTDRPLDSGEPDLGPWVVRHEVDLLLIGVVTCSRTELEGEVSVGYEIAPSYRGRGCATEALGAAVEHLLSTPGVTRVSAVTTADHTASRRVMEKAGLRLQHEEQEHRDNRTVTLVHYAIDRPAPL
jgi:[ribosomal protein S5]-alanine N-acetyltransferase